ncbi:MAG: DUF362 domain-containing protein [Coriobacteriia bacterium]|nr:DUF362 domain-containing protein [Coriobacteriia bacterium]MCL2749893.1 DUF362 domain-containing protein [Coriobacteriia bacterium]
MAGTTENEHYDSRSNLKEASGITRRHFVGGALVVGAGLALTELTACTPSPTGAGQDDELLLGDEELDSSDSALDESVGTPPSTEDSSVYVVRNTDGTDDGMQRLIKVMERNNASFYQSKALPEGLIAANDVVILKINCQWAERGGTNTDLIEAVALALAAHPDGFTGELIIADNGQAQYGTGGFGGSLDWSHTNAADKTRSPLDVVNSLRPQMNISGVLWDEFTMNQVAEFASGDNNNGFVLEDEPRHTGIVISYPKFTSEYGTRVSFKEGIWDSAKSSYDTSRLKVINLPVLKVHGGFQVTGAVKNYMGTTASRLTNQAAHNSVGKGGMGTQLAFTRMPTLNLMDMIWVGTRRGPHTRYDDADANNMIACSTDPVALDWWCAHNVLTPLVEASGSSTAKLNPDATEQGTFGYWLSLSADELLSAGHKANRGNSVRVFE